MYAAQVSGRADIRRIRRERVLKKQRERRRTLLTIFLASVFLFGIGVGFGTLFARAKEPEQAPMYKYYTNREIQRGDTLWGLAEAYMDGAHYKSRRDYINEVMALNHMVTSRLISGQKLILPYYSEEMK